MYEDKVVKKMMMMEFATMSRDGDSRDSDLLTSPDFMSGGFPSKT